MQRNDADPVRGPSGASDRPNVPDWIGRFRVTARLGEGGMGLVFAARDPALERPVAVKVIRRELLDDSTMRQRFWREARIVADVTDPRICRVYEVGEHDGQLFIVMELLEGEPLAALLQRGVVPLARSFSILLDILAALEALHERGIVHRDLKPSNVFLTRDGAKLVDFGLARQSADPTAETHPALTRAGTIVGTPRYMAPEQLLDRSVDPRTDVFAAGSLLYEMLAGRPAFDADSLMGAMQRVLNQEPPSLGGSPEIEAADRVIQRALSAAPEARYPSARAMAADVRTLLVFAGPGDAPVVAEPRAPGRSIAVLPFLGIGAEADEFADGMTEDVIARLSRIRALRVIARASVAGFKDRAVPPKEIGARLGVRTLLDGSIRRAGTRVRVVTQLVDIVTETHIWSQTYDRDLTDVFDVQAEVAHEIARALEVELTSAERARVGRRPTERPEAQHLYLKGRHCLLKYTADGVRQGLSFLEEAVADDHTFALGHAWIALGHIIAAMGYDGGALPPAASYERAREAAQRALTHDAELGDAHGALGFVKLVMDFDWEGSERAFRRALQLSPNSELIWSEYGLLLSALDRNEESIAAYRRARELDPLTAVHTSTLASMLIRAGRVDEALEEARSLIELRPEFPMAHSTLGWAYLKRGATNEGLAAIEQAVALAPGNTMLLGQLGHAYGLASRPERAREILARMHALADTRHVSPYHLAYVHAGLGQADEAVTWLERAYEERAGGIYGMRGSFLFAGLADHPRFMALLQKMNQSPGRAAPPAAT